MSSSRENLEKYIIPLKEIILATKNFSQEAWIGDGGYGVMYKGQLSESWQNQVVAIKRLNENSKQGENEFRNELEMIIRFKHENVNAFVGYCDENNEMIIAYVYAVNGSLDFYLKDPEKMRCITWEQRLKICIGAARGLNFLHTGLGKNNIVIHRNVKSANIVFNENMKAEICGFDLSVAGPRYQPHSHAYTNAVGTKFYLDPHYIESGILKIETDVYSFGVLMFEMLSGTLVHEERKIGEDSPGPLMNLVRRYEKLTKGLEKLIDPSISDQIKSRSFIKFKELACNCVSWAEDKRPSMDMIIRKIEEALEVQVQNEGVIVVATPGWHEKFDLPLQNVKVKLEQYLIPLEEIIKATKNYSSENLIGTGGFGKVYKGQLSENWENRLVAIKCLSVESYQGAPEFHNELKLISILNHENVIPFIGYCHQGQEMIIVYEYAVNGSLDHHLLDMKKRCCLTWLQRLNICLGMARGLQYLHFGLGEENRVIHRDIKSGNILLDANLEAKICDFGLSKAGPRNQLHTELYTKAAGTHCYVDPFYQESGILRKESDVYSYGVVLFELFSGMLAYDGRDLGDGKPERLMYLVRRYEKDPEKLIDPVIRDQIDIDSISTHAFIEIAYKCISFTFEERPTMDVIVKKIEEVIGYLKE